MMESVWLPGLVVLGVGALVGLIVALRLRRTAPSDRADLELKVTDLRARREQLYERLRAAVDRGDESEIDRLETAAARVLRDLERDERELPSERVEAVAAAPARASTAPEGWATRHPLTVGFLFGAGLVALVGVLFYWAVRDAGPRPDTAVLGAPPPTANSVGPQGAVEIPPQILARMDQLRTQITSSPDDLASRRELSLIHLQASQYVEAFQQAQEILNRDPRDLDALYVQGVVRLTMGQLGIAKGLFDQVIAMYPEHVRALVARGAILFRLGDQAGAVADWESGLAAAGGTHPELESLLARAREAGATVGAASAPTPTPATPTAQPSLAPAGPTFGVRIALDGAPRPGAVLFVSLRGDAPGPPAAVRRIDAPRFPLEIQLTSADSMLGRPLPESGTLSVRLDADGSASTREPTDPVAEATVRSGDTVELVLR